jgi:hypothetical protein
LPGPGVTSYTVQVASTGDAGDHERRNVDSRLLPKLPFDGGSPLPEQALQEKPGQGGIVTGNTKGLSYHSDDLTVELLATLEFHGRYSFLSQFLV